MSALSHIQYFLGANAPGGFYSLYAELLPPEDARRVYILKGGPGCGKSTLMRRVGEQLEEAGLEPEYILCSGDPGSLDALVLPRLGAAIVDGTAPHVVEPKCPGAVERYVNLGACYDCGALAPLRGEIAAATAEYKGHYRRAYRCLEASAEVFEDMRATLLTGALEEKLARRAVGIQSRELRNKRGNLPGQVKQRFLGAVTCRGRLCLYDTALAQCGRVYELADSFGLAHEVLIRLLAGATAAGYDAVACPDPMAPDRLAHLLVPGAGVCFLTSTAALPLEGPRKPYRRIRLDGTVDKDLLRRSRARLRFSRRVSAALLDEGVDSLAQAKAAHDRLEAIYNPHVDFEKVVRIADRIAEELL